MFRRPSKDESTGQSDAVPNHPSLIRRYGTDETMRAIGKYIKEHNLLYVNIMEIDGGIIIHGTVNEATEWGWKTTEKMLVIDEATLKSLIAK